MTELIDALKTQGPLVVALVIAVIFFYRRDRNRDKLMAEGTKKCEEREERLTEKVEAQDKRFTEHVSLQHSETMTLLNTCARALETCARAFDVNAQAFSKLTDIETDRFPIRTESNPR